ncbi:MAG: aspartate/tyrosine/aromatic aminotransferase [bacterium]|nr:aspartate/tyrosine/aromatic aminotransferase [bacterium]
MFDKLEMAPPDAIMGLTEAFKKDPNPNRINLGVGVYKDANGKTPVMDCVKQAEGRLHAGQDTKSYLSIDGDPDYGAAVRRLVFGADHEIVASERAATAQTPGGTGALRVASDFVAAQLPGSTLWMSDPTWANHPNIFRAAGVPVSTYPYYDAEAKALDFEAMIAALSEVPAGDVVLLHGCCHNPSGMDPDPDQWAQIADCAADRGWIPLFDFAYQGLADGIDEDAAGLRLFLKPGCELFVCTSFSKNFGLYNERVGALTVVAASKDAAAKAQSHIKKVIRANYSNPPAHGALVVTTVLNDADLSAQWHKEVAEIRDRINGMRKQFVEALKAKGVSGDYSFLTRQKGMFSFSGLNKDQVAALRDKHSVYIVGSGRINVAGMTDANIDRLCEAIADVM